MNHNEDSDLEVSMSVLTSFIGTQGIGEHAKCQQQEEQPQKDATLGSTSTPLERDNKLTPIPHHIADNVGIIPLTNFSSEQTIASTPQKLQKIVSITSCGIPGSNLDSNAYRDVIFQCMVQYYMEENLASKPKRKRRNKPIFERQRKAYLLGVDLEKVNNVSRGKSGLRHGLCHGLIMVASSKIDLLCKLIAKQQKLYFPDGGQQTRQINFCSVNDSNSITSKNQQTPSSSSLLSLVNLPVNSKNQKLNSSSNLGLARNLDADGSLSLNIFHKMEQWWRMGVKKDLDSATKNATLTESCLALPLVVLPGDSTEYTHDNYSDASIWSLNGDQWQKLSSEAKIMYVSSYAHCFLNWAFESEDFCFSEFTLLE